MMQTTNHPVAGEELMAYLDGELTGDRGAFVEDHFHGCLECQNLAAELHFPGRRLAEWQIEEASFQLKEPLHAPVRPRFKALFMRSAWVWAPAGAALLVGVMYFSNTRVTRKEYQNFDVMDSRVLPRLSPGGVFDRKEFISPPGLQTAPDSGPMIIRTAELRILTRSFENARASVQQTVSRFSGYVGDLTVSAAAGAPRTLQADLRVPAAQLDGLLAALRGLGQMTYESQHGVDVTKQFIDVNARLNNAREYGAAADRITAGSHRKAFRCARSRGTD